MTYPEIPVVNVADEELRWIMAVCSSRAHISISCYQNGNVSPINGTKRKQKRNIMQDKK